MHNDSNIWNWITLVKYLEYEFGMIVKYYHTKFYIYIKSDELKSFLYFLVLSGSGVHFEVKMFTTAS